MSHDNHNDQTSALHSTPKQRKVSFEENEAKLKAILSHGALVPIAILYGSETGNAQSIAEAMHEKSASKGYDSVLATLDEYRSERVAWFHHENDESFPRIVIIIVSTTGNGDAPNNSLHFWRYIRKRTLDPSLLSKTQYMVLGLGDTNYDKFCHVGKTLDKRFEQLGAHRIASIACADEAMGVDATVEPWMVEVWEKLDSLAGNNDTNVEKEKENKIIMSPKIESAKLESNISQLGNEEKIETKKAKIDESLESSIPNEIVSVSPNANHRPILVLYGSQTGNSESIAKIFHDKAVARGYDSTLATLDNFKDGYVNWINEHLEEESTDGSAPNKKYITTSRVVIMVVSTTGNGDAPQNADLFWRFIKRRTHSNNLLEETKYVLLGLGDTNYSKFCNIGKGIDRRLQELNAKRLSPMVCADEAVGLDTFVEPWFVDTWQTLAEEFKFYPAAISPLLQSNKLPIVIENLNNMNILSLDGSNNSASQEKLLLDQEEVKPSELKISIDNLLPRADLSLEAIQKREVQATTLRNNTFSVTLINSESNESLNDENTLSKRMIMHESSFIGTCKDHPIDAKLVQSRYLTTNISEKRVMLMKLELDNHFKLDWYPGDSIGILCPNPPSIVNSVISRLNLDPNSRYKISHMKSLENERAGRMSKSALAAFDSHSIDGSISVLDTLTWCLDLTSSLLRVSVLRMMAERCSDELDRARLMLLSSANGKAEYQALFENQKINFSEALELFPSCQPTFSDLVNFLPTTTPRYYSIIGSPIDSPYQFDICFRVVEDRIKYGGDNALPETNDFRVVKGMCTSWMEQISKLHSSNQAQSFKFKVFLRSSAEFRLPSALDKPIIMIGPGTGVAPFIGFIRHRYNQAKMEKTKTSEVATGYWRGGIEFEDLDDGLDDDYNIENKFEENTSQNQITSNSEGNVGENILYFGCRNENEDYLFKDEIEDMVKQDKLNHLRVAFSRKNPNKKVYVQDYLWDDRDKLVRMLSEEYKANIYVCGDGSKMAQEVHSTLAKIISYGKNISVDEALLELKEMMRRGRYARDVW